MSIASNNPAALQTEVADTARWMASERFAGLKRPYSAQEVVSLRGNLRVVPKGAVMSKKLWALLKECQRRGTCSNTFGALDPVQVIQMAPHLTSVYVSGWQCSSTASTTNEPGPDFADYPYTTVPNKVDQLFRAQCFHDRKQRQARMAMTEEQRKATPEIDYLRPIVADGDAAFGGQTNCMKLLNLFIEAGAAGVHIEDQRPSAKKCGHMGGKVLVSVQEHIDRLVAARLQADIMGSETVLVARTDAEASQYVDSNIDARDHCFIMGSTNPQLKKLNCTLKALDQKGASPAEKDRATKQWEKDAKLKTFVEAVEELLVKRGAPQQQIAAWRERTVGAALRGQGPHINEMRRIAAEYGVGEKDVFWCWEAPRTREGFYRAQPGNDWAVSRSVSFASYADICWVETHSPDVQQAKYISDNIHRAVPGKFLAYNCSPSFNWSAFLNDRQVESFQQDLGKMGFVFQFITLAGFHANGLKLSQFAKDYSRRGMLAYVETVQKPEKEHAPDLLTHQTWSGANLMDAALMIATGGGASTTAQQEGSTEAQFKAKL